MIDPTYIKIAAPTIESINQVHPKDNLIKTARQLGLTIPQTWIPENEDDLHQYIGEMNFPVFLKLPDAIGGKGIVKTETAEQLLNEYRRMKTEYGLSEKRKALVQEAVGKEDYCFTGLFHEGELIAHMTYRNLRSIPKESGFGSWRETVDSTPFVPIAKKLMKAIEWNGVVEIDFRGMDHDGSEPYMLEVNPRFWGGLFQSVESGVDYPWLLYQMTVYGKTEENVEAELGTQTRIPLVDEFAALENILHDLHMQESLQAQWKKLVDEFKQGSWKDGFNTLSETIGNLWHSTPKLQEIIKELKKSRSAKVEFLNSDDPFVVFGGLFIIGSLIRTGKLPEELRR